MENIKWSELSISEIKLKQLSLKNEYESKKNKIISLIDELDELDRLYSNGNNELKKRMNSNIF